MVAGANIIKKLTFVLFVVLNMHIFTVMEAQIGLNDKFYYLCALKTL